MGKICSNCGKECGTLESWRLRDGNVVCYDCCDSIIKKNDKLDLKGKYFWKNVHVLDLIEFQLVYKNPELASLCNTQEILTLSPFKKKNYSKLYCVECGNEVLKEDTVCCNCKKSITNPVEKKIEAEQFDFERTKWFGKFSKTERSTVLMFDEYMDITKKILDNLSVEEVVIKYTDINKKTICFDFTKWQFILAILALVVGILGEPVTLLLTPVLLWMSYGKVFVIHTKNGNIVKIAYKKDNEDVNKIISIINERCAMNSGKQLLNNYERVKEDIEEKRNIKFCAKCGTEVLSESQKYCTKCGNILQEDGKEKKIKKNIIAKIFGSIIGIGLISYLAISMFSNGERDIEYTNNSGEKLPVIVKGISLSESYWNGYLDMNITLENLSDNDYRKVTIAIMAWDSNGFPIGLEVGWIDPDTEYIKYISTDNFAAYEMKEDLLWYLNNVDIEYMSAFLVSYTDFDGKEWENPILDYVIECEGKKLEDIDFYYFTFN